MPANGWRRRTEMSEMKYRTVDFGTAEAVFNKLGGMDGIRLFLADELVVVPKTPPVVLPPVPEPPIDFTVRVDRSVKPAYPSWSDRVMYPKLQRTGPAKYNLRDNVEQWLHPNQLSVCTGETIYESLKRDSALTDQLGLADLQAIQKMGIKVVFRKLFSGKTVFGWKSVVRSRGSRNLRVPYLYDGGYEVVLRWRSLVLDWSSGDPALRFRK